MPGKMVAKENAPAVLRLRQVPGRRAIAHRDGAVQRVHRNTYTAFDPATKPEVRKTIRKVYNFIWRNFAKLRYPNYRTKLDGITIENRSTGSWKGQNHKATLEVTVPGSNGTKHFFVKISSQNADQIVWGMAKMADFLKQHDNQVRNNQTKENFRITILKPLIVHDIYVRKYGGSMLVTPFFDEKTVVLAADIPDKRIKDSVGNALKIVAEWVEKDYGQQAYPVNPIEIHSGNAFYNPRAHTIILFDYLTIK